MLQLRGLAKAHDCRGALQDLEGRADTEELLAACAECHSKLGTYPTFKVSSIVFGTPQPGQSLMLTRSGCIRTLVLAQNFPMGSLTIAFPRMG